MTLLQIEDVSFGYVARRPVLAGVSLALQEGRSLGIVGESGSGKTTLLRLLLGFARPASGRIVFDGRPLDPASRRFMRGYRRQVQPVFQDPYGSLDPRRTVRAIVSEPLRALRIAGDHRRMVEDALVAVGLGGDIVGRYPHEFSGGQRQRIAIARAIVAGPRLLLADEAVSALDLSTRVRIVELFRSLGQRMTLVFVSHDIGVVASLCDDVVVLERGRIAEMGATRQVLVEPRHPYTRKLLASVPRMPA